MPGIKSPDKFTPNGDNKELKISDVQTREEQAVQLLRKDKQVREQVRGADKSFAERRSASGRFDVARDLNASREAILKSIVTELKRDPSASVETIIESSAGFAEMKAMSPEIMEKLVKRGEKIRKVLKLRDAALEKMTLAEEGSTEELLYKKAVDVNQSKLEALETIE